MKFAPTDPRGRRRVLIVIVVLIAVLLALLLGNAFVFNVFLETGDSMAPAIAKGDVIVNFRLAYRFGQPQRGDIVAMKLPGAPDDSTCRYVRRIVGLPGETISLQKGAVCIDGKPLAEAYVRTLPSGVRTQTTVQLTDPDVPADAWASAAPAWALFRPFTVPEGSYFVLADDRAQGGDSRLFGPVQRDAIVGEVLWR
jgi:signal peptidase I